MVTIYNYNNGNFAFGNWIELFKRLRTSYTTTTLPISPFVDSLHTLGLNKKVEGAVISRLRLRHSRHCWVQLSLLMRRARYNLWATDLQLLSGPITYQLNLHKNYFIIVDMAWNDDATMVDDDEDITALVFSWTHKKIVIECFVSWGNNDTCCDLSVSRQRTMWVNERFSVICQSARLEFHVLK